MAAIYDVTTGNTITEGLQGCNICDEAILAAQRIADDRREDVLLVDDDGEWIVHPIISGKREPATCRIAEMGDEPRRWLLEL